MPEKVATIQLTDDTSTEDIANFYSTLEEIHEYTVEIDASKAILEVYR